MSVGDPCIICGPCVSTCCTYKIWARVWTFSVANIANKAVCTNCAHYNGNWTIYSLNGTCLWSTNDTDGGCTTGTDSWTMSCSLIQPFFCPLQITDTIIGLYFNRDNAAPNRDPNNNCAGIGGQQPNWQQDFWSLKVADFNPVGVNVLPYTCPDARACRDCDASNVGPITITPVFA